MRNTYFIVKDKRFYWDIDDGLMCEGKDGVKVLEQVMGVAIPEEDKKFLKDLTKEDISKKEESSSEGPIQLAVGRERAEKIKVSKNED